MAAPNIAATTTITGKTAVQALNTVAAIVSNGSSSGTVVKIESLIISNIHASTAGTVTVDLYRSSTAHYICKAVTVPIFTALTVIERGSAIYLEEGDDLRLTAGAASTLEAVCSYEIIS